VMAYRYFIVYKPFHVLSQFTEEIPGQLTLHSLGVLPKNIYPVGRLDKDSEGLLLLTNDKALNHQLLHPKFKHQRTYWIQVEGIPKEEDLAPLRVGISIRIKKKLHQTAPAIVRIIAAPTSIPERNPPVRFRKDIPTSWLEITLTEGKNRQVRRMSASIGFPVLRLIRNRIEDLSLKELKGQPVIELKKEQVYQLLNINRTKR